jgi:hypothetical protein
MLIAQATVRTAINATTSRDRLANGGVGSSVDLTTLAFGPLGTR